MTGGVGPGTRRWPVARSPRFCRGVERSRTPPRGVLLAVLPVLAHSPGEQWRMRFTATSTLQALARTFPVVGWLGKVAEGDGGWELRRTQVTAMPRQPLRLTSDLGFPGEIPGPVG